MRARTLSNDGAKRSRAVSRHAHKRSAVDRLYTPRRFARCAGTRAVHALDNPHSRDAGMAELIIAKAREGETTTVPLVWNGARSRFESACGGMPSWNKTETATDRGFEL